MEHYRLAGRNNITQRLIVAHWVSHRKISQVREVPTVFSARHNRGAESTACGLSSLAYTESRAEYRCLGSPQLSARSALDGGRNIANLLFCFCCMNI